MDSATIELPPAPPNISSSDVHPEDVDDNIGPIPNPVTPNFLVRPDRHQVVYNAEERKVLDAHKERYLASRSMEERKSVAKTYILPAIFQYWDSIGHDIGDSRTQARKLVAWIQNTWRGTKIAETVIAGAAMKKTEVLWQTRKEDVFAEIARLMGLDSASTQMPNWFAFRMKALGNILQHMSALELEQLDRKGEAIVSTANQDEDRRQLLAKKNAIPRFSKAAKSHWNEMGILALSFVAYTDSSGKLVVQVHDQMAELMEVDAPLFESEYKPQVHEMKLYVMEYITKMKRILNPGPQPWAPGGDGNDGRDLSLQFDGAGFPILPQGLDTKSGNLPVKKELDEMIRKYLAKHYKLATRGQREHVPYKQVQEHQAQFILPEYLPRGFEMKDPRDLTLLNLISLIDHILGRQKTHPISHVFRFSMVNAKRKGYEPIRTHYPDEDGNEGSPEPDPNPDSDSAPTTGKQSKKQRKSKAGKGKRIAQPDGQSVFRLGDNLLQMSPDSNSDPELSEYVSRTIDKGKGKAIGPDPDIQLGVIQEAMESLNDPVSHHFSPQLYPDSDSHAQHVNLNAWDWGTNSAPYQDRTYNAGVYPDIHYNAGLTVADSYSAGSSNAEATQGPLNADPDDGLDDMEYFRRFSASQNPLYNSGVDYQFRDAHTEPFMSNTNVYSLSLTMPAPLPCPVPTEQSPQLNTGTASIPAYVDIPGEAAGPNTGTGTDTLKVPDNPTAAPIVNLPQSNQAEQNESTTLRSSSGEVAGYEVLSRLAELPVVDPCNITGPLPGVNPVVGAEAGPATCIGPNNSIVMPIVEPLHDRNPKHSGKRAVRTSDILALLESESDKLRVNGLRKRVRKVRE